jgi:hypothetical protein
MEQEPPEAEFVTTVMPRTHLLEHRAKRRDDDLLLALIRNLPVFGSSSCEVFRMGLLNESGELYREVRLSGEYEALLFTAQMNAGGFTRLKPDALHLAEGFDSLFAKR